MGKFELAVKAEITRLSKRETRRFFEPLKREVRELRTAVTALKKALKGAAGARTPAALPKLTLPADVAAKSRMSPRLVKKVRERFDLSQAQLAGLVGVSSASITLWEQGKARPTGRNREALVALRGLGKRQVKRLLAQKSPEAAAPKRA